MPLLTLSTKLKHKGISHYHILDTVVEKIHFDDHHEFLETIKHRKNQYWLEVFIKNKPALEKYTREEYLKLKVRLAEKIEHLNSLNLGITFDRFGLAPVL